MSTQGPIIPGMRMPGGLSIPTLDELFTSRQTTRTHRLPPIFGTLLGTGGTSLTTGGTATNPMFDVRLPETIAQLRGESLAGTRGLNDQVTRDIGTLRGLENPFIQARVRPLEQARDERLAQLERGLRRRGGLNSLTESFITGEGQRLNQGIGDARVQALEESQGAIRAAQQFQQQLNERIGNVGQQELQQALAELGLSQQQMQLFLQSMFPDSQTTTARGTPASLIGSIITAIGAGGAASAAVA